MILERLFAAFVGVVSGILDLLPSFGLPPASSVNGVIGDSRVWQWLAWANHFLPISFATVLLSARLGLWAGLHLVDAVLWLATKVHVLGGSS